VKKRRQALRPQSSEAGGNEEEVSLRILEQLDESSKNKRRKAFKRVKYKSFTITRRGWFSFENEREKSCGKLRGHLNISAKLALSVEIVRKKISEDDRRS